MHEPPRRVAVIDANPDDRRIIESYLNRLGLGFAGFESGEAFLACPPLALRGCLVVDWGPPGGGGVELLNELERRRVPVTPIVVSSEASVERAVSAMRAGAVDYLVKPVAFEDFRRAVETAIVRDIQRREQHARHESILDLYSRLSPRECQVVNLIYSGKSNKEVAEWLAISTKTVEAHRHNARVKLKLTSTADLVRLVHEVGEALE